MDAHNKGNDKNESVYERTLVVIALVLCAIIIGYNLFYQANVEIIEFQVSSNTTESVSESEEYVPVHAGSENELLKKIESHNQEKIININTATAEELVDNLTGIGKVIAESIIEYREYIGGFTDIEQLKEVEGIGDKKYEAIKDVITI